MWKQPTLEGSGDEGNLGMKRGLETAFLSEKGAPLNAWRLATKELNGTHGRYRWELPPSLGLAKPHQSPSALEGSDRLEGN